MRRAADLESRLTEWGREYGGGRYENYIGMGNSPLASMIRWHGRPPSGLGYVATDTPAEAVEEAVCALEHQRKGSTPASVLREEYLKPGQPRVAKLRRLSMTEVRYCQHLRIAKIHVAAWIRVPFDEPMELSDSVAMLALVAGLD